MIRKLFAGAGMAVLWLLAPLASAQPQAASFDLVVRAPDPLKEILERNLELRRYREVTDLDDAEIARLIVLAEKDARELLATQGYFAPQVRISREPGTRPTLLVAVEPGRARASPRPASRSRATSPPAAMPRPCRSGKGSAPAGRCAPASPSRRPAGTARSRKPRGS
ncbi:POTRA domain-containing protein [Ramlibacter montanisoli]|uniref:POTRA domain-containing protein n=1 Tax=Ramlibacter montanisoli TaxID=2732512 RepID=UPI00209BF289|nr:POTRA domain-containing protein [Ramlibacter montanisoli]